MATLSRNEEKMANVAMPNFQHKEKFTELSCRKLKNLDMTLVLTAYGSLTTVNLSNNLLTILPYSFSQCLSHVQVLDLSRNHLQKLPDNFDRMQSLHTLIIYQNKVGSPSLKGCLNAYASFRNSSWFIAKDFAGVLWKPEQFTLARPFSQSSRSPFTTSLW